MPLPSPKRKKSALLILLSLFYSSFLFAQQNITVKGTVIAEKNAPLPGVSVNVKGTTKGTTTDAGGRFSIQVSKGSTLVLSFVGYRQMEVVVNDKTAINVQMVSSGSDLSEVMVVSYGTQKKRDITGSIRLLGQGLCWNQRSLSSRLRSRCWS